MTHFFAHCKRNCNYTNESIVQKYYITTIFYIHTILLGLYFCEHHANFSQSLCYSFNAYVDVLAIYFKSVLHHMHSATKLSVVLNLPICNISKNCLLCNHI